MLSDAGMARREEGLEALRKVVKRRGRRRVVVRAGAGVAAALALVVGVAMMTGRGKGESRVAESKGRMTEGGSPDGLGDVPRAVATARDVERRIAGVGVVETDPRVLSVAIATDARVVAELAPVGRARLDRIDDDGLQRALRAAGEPAGIVRIGRRVMTEGELGQAGM